MVALGLKLHRLFYGQRRQVNRKSAERTEDDLPVPLIPSAAKTIRRAEGTIQNRDVNICIFV